MTLKTLAGRPAPGPGATGTTLVTRLQQSSLDEPLEAGTRDVSVHALLGSELVHRDPMRTGTRIQKGTPQLRVADGAQLVHLYLYPNRF